VRKATRYTTRG